jgi:hypothetical protein
MRSGITLLVATLMSALPVRAEMCDSLDSVRWLVGEWSTVGEGRQVQETWTVVSPDTFEGFGAVRSPETAKISVTETLRLVAMSGGVYFIAKVSENDLPVPFAMTSCGNNFAVFENPLHDSPKRITYRLDGHNRMTVSVESDGGRGFTLVFGRRSGSETD